MWLEVLHLLLYYLKSVEGSADIASRLASS
jgi:hypothetical protein